MKSEQNIKVAKILSDPKNEAIMSQILSKMTKLYMRKKSFQHEYPVLVYDDRLWIGNYYFANKQQFLVSNRIKFVVSCLKSTPNKLSAIVYKNFEINDGKDTRFETYAYQFIQFVQSNHEPIFVHCFSGKSRSVSFIIAYIMFRQKITFDQALQMIKLKYAIAAPNQYFQQKLRQMQKQIHQFSTKNENLLDGDIAQILSSPKKIEENVKLEDDFNLLQFNEPAESKKQNDSPQQKQQTFDLMGLNPNTSPKKQQNLINIFQEQKIQDKGSSLIDIDFQQPKNLLLISEASTQVSSLLDTSNQPNLQQHIQFGLPNIQTFNFQQNIEYGKNASQVIEDNNGQQAFADSVDFSQEKKKKKKKKK